MLAQIGFFCPLQSSAAVCIQSLHGFSEDCCLPSTVKAVVCLDTSLENLHLKTGLRCWISQYAVHWQDAFDGRPFARLLEQAGLDGQLRKVLLHAVALSPWSQQAHEPGAPAVPALCICMVTPSFLRKRERERVCVRVWRSAK